MRNLEDITGTIINGDCIEVMKTLPESSVDLVVTSCPYGVGIAYDLHDDDVEFEEYKLDNGLHIILHQDNSAPVVSTGLMFHVGAKNEDSKKTGFAHFFEHLLFEFSRFIFVNC